MSLRWLAAALCLSSSHKAPVRVRILTSSIVWASAALAARSHLAKGVEALEGAQKAVPSHGWCGGV
jgi:hypothetical protein